MAKKVACFDLCQDGSVVYSDGASIFWMDAKANGKTERVLSENGIQQVTVLE